MTPQQNANLDKIRNYLVNEAFGPESSNDSEVAANSAPGVSGATNSTDVWDTMDLYFTGMIAKLVADYEMDEEEAEMFVLDVADMMADEGDLPALPDEEAPDDAVAIWLGKAKSVDLAAMVCAMADEDDEDAETE